METLSEIIKVCARTQTILSRELTGGEIEYCVTTPPEYFQKPYYTFDSATAGVVYKYRCELILRQGGDK